jgi:hypothetical protein
VDIGEGHVSVPGVPDVPGLLGVGVEAIDVEHLQAVGRVADEGEDLGTVASDSSNRRQARSLKGW